MYKAVSITRTIAECDLIPCSQWGGQQCHAPLVVVVVPRGTKALGLEVESEEKLCPSAVQVDWQCHLGGGGGGVCNSGMTVMRGRMMALRV